MAPSAVTKKSENIKQSISHKLPNGFAKICVILMLSLSSKCEGTKQVRHSIPRNFLFFLDTENCILCVLIKGPIALSEMKHFIVRYHHQLFTTVSS